MNTLNVLFVGSPLDHLAASVQLPLPLKVQVVSMAKTEDAERAHGSIDSAHIAADDGRGNLIGQPSIDEQNDCLAKFSRPGQQRTPGNSLLPRR